MDRKRISDVECRFCEIFNKNNKSEEIDRPISKNEDFMALVSKGAIVKGWVLVIPRVHTYSMRKFYCDDSFIHFTDSILNQIRKNTKKIVLFLNMVQIAAILLLHAEQTMHTCILFHMTSHC